MICGVCCLVTCLWWAIISITSWLLVPLPHNVSPSLNQRCHYGQSEDTPRPHNEPIIRLPVTISAPFSQLPLPLTSSWAGLLINHAQCSEALSSRTFNLHHLFICGDANLWSYKWAFPLQDDFVRRKVSTVINHMFSTAQRVWLFRRLSKLFKSTDWKHQVCYFSQVSVARKCQKSSQQFSLWSIHMV